MSMLGNYFKVAVRNLLRHKVYSAINIIGLAVGLDCCIVISPKLFCRFSFDRFQRNFERLRRIKIGARFSDQEPFKHAGSFGPMSAELIMDYPSCPVTPGCNWTACAIQTRK